MEIKTVIESYEYRRIGTTSWLRLTKIEKRPINKAEKGDRESVI